MKIKIQENHNSTAPKSRPLQSFLDVKINKSLCSNISVNTIGNPMHAQRLSTVITGDNRVTWSSLIVIVLQAPVHSPLNSKA